MISVLTDFEERVNEIELYFDHLNLILNKDAELFFPNNKTRQRKRIEPELHKVLKANCFLLLYNLSESSMRQALTEIFEKISEKELEYSMVKDEIKKIWISSNYKNFKDIGIDKIFDAITVYIFADIINIQFEEKSDLSGAVDGQKIREFATKLGFSSTVHYSLKEGRKLHQVKVQRNKLAHGNISFAKCGRDYTIEELNLTKTQVIGYLRRILTNIKVYLENENFKVIDL
jgi:hypothetical protein